MKYKNLKFGDILVVDNNCFICPTKTERPYGLYVIMLDNNNKKVAVSCK